MQIETNTLIYVLFALIGAGFKFFSKWMGNVDAKLEKLGEQKMECSQRFVSREDFVQGKDHIWEKLESHEQRIRSLEGRR